MDANKTIPGMCRLMRIREVLQLSGLSRATLYREIKSHAFPAPVKLSLRSVGWLQDDVTQWLQARVSQRGPTYQANSHSEHRDSKGTKQIKPVTRLVRDESE